MYLNIYYFIVFKVLKNYFEQHINIKKQYNEEIQKIRKQYAIYI